MVSNPLPWNIQYYAIFSEAISLFTHITSCVEGHAHISGYSVHHFGIIITFIDVS